MTVPRVKITELGTSGDKEELRKVYSKYGSLTNVWIATNPPGFAYVFYHTFEEAEKAVEHTNGKKICGVTVRVELSPIEDKYRQQNDRRDRYESDRGGGGYHSDFKYRQSRDNYHDNRFSSRGRGRGGGGGRGFRYNKGGMYQERNHHRGYSDDDYYRRRGGQGGGFRGRGSPARGYSGRGRGGGRDYNDGYGHRGRGRGTGRPRMEFSPSPQGRPMRGRVHSGGYRDDRGGSQGRYREEIEYKRRPRREYYDEGQEFWPPPLSPHSPRSPHRGHHRRVEPEFSGRGGRREGRGRRREEHEFYETEGSRGYDEFRNHRGSKGFQRKRSFSDEDHHHHQGRRSSGKEDYYLKDSHDFPSLSKSYDYHRSGHDRDYLKEETRSSRRYRKESFLSSKEEWDYRGHSPPSPRDRSPLHFPSSSHKSPTHHRSHRHYYKPSSGQLYAADDLVLHRKPRSVSSTLSSASRSRSGSPSLSSLRGSRSRSASRSPSLRRSPNRAYSDRSRSRSHSRSRSSYSDYTPPPPPLDDNYRSPLGGGGGGGGGGSDYEPVDTYQTEDTYESRRYPTDERYVKYSPRSGSSGRSSLEEENGQKSSGLREIKYSSKDADRLVEIGSKNLHYEKHRDVSHRDKKRRYSFSPVAERGRGISPPSSRRRTSTRKKRMPAPASSHRSRSRSPL